MKHHLTVLGCFLLLATLGFALDIGVTAAKENPEGTVPPGESFLPGDIKFESPKGNVRIYFPIVTAIVLSILFTLILRFTSPGRDRSPNSPHHAAFP